MLTKEEEQKVYEKWGEFYMSTSDWYRAFLFAEVEKELGRELTPDEQGLVHITASIILSPDSKPESASGDSGAEPIIDGKRHSVKDLLNKLKQKP